MRIAGIVLVVFGLLASVLGLMRGLGDLFTWNGRHPIDEMPLDEGANVHRFVPSVGRRYTASVQVTIDPASVETRDGRAVAEARMPLVIRIEDGDGTRRAEAIGWLDPQEPPNVLYSQGGNRRAPDLWVERLVGPVLVSSTAPLTVHVNLGADTIGKNRVLERRLVVYDDALPPGIKTALALGGAGVLALVAGVFILVLGWLRRLMRGKKRSERRPPAAEPG